MVCTFYSISQARTTFDHTPIQYAFLHPAPLGDNRAAVAAHTQPATRHAGRAATTGLFSQMKPRGPPMNQPVCHCASVYIYVLDLYTLSFALAARTSQSLATPEWSWHFPLYFVLL